MNAKLGWDTAVAASEPLFAEVVQLKAEIERLKAENENLRTDTVRIELLETAVEQALDDMGEKGLSVCQQAKEMLQAALAGKGGT